MRSARRLWPRCSAGCWSGGETPSGPRALLRGRRRRRPRRAEAAGRLSLPSAARPPARRARAEAPQVLVGVDPRGVAVGPGDGDRVAPHRRDLDGPHPLEREPGVEEGLPAPLVDAPGAAAAPPEVGDGIDALVAVAPEDPEL